MNVILKEQSHPTETAISPTLPRHSARGKEHTGANAERPWGNPTSPPEHFSHQSSGTQMPYSATTRVERGLTRVIAPRQLRDEIRMKTLTTLNRLRVIRTIDVAAICFPERPFKASLAAAQRAMRGMLKDRLIGHFRTDRHQHVYGLAQGGVNWLADHDIDAASSVRRVSDMTNPEHLLWANFIACCAQARGLEAHTEPELLQALGHLGEDGKPAKGLLRVNTYVQERSITRYLRPDAIAYESDGATWFEIDRSKRGSEREALLGGLFTSIGRRMQNGLLLRRVVVFAKTQRTYQRALTIAYSKSEVEGCRLRSEGDAQLRPTETEGQYEVWGLVKAPPNNRFSLVEARTGHVMIQHLPLWLPRIRLNSSNTVPVNGWFPDNYLPYMRPHALGSWSIPTSPFLQTNDVTAG